MTKVNIRVLRNTVVFVLLLAVAAYSIYQLFLVMGKTTAPAPGFTPPAAQNASAAESENEPGRRPDEPEPTAAEAFASEAFASGAFASGAYGFDSADGADGANGADLATNAGFLLNGDAEAFPNGVYSETGALLLAAAGYDINAYEPAPGSGLNAGAKYGLPEKEPGDTGLTMSQQLAAKLALYPIGPLSALAEESVSGSPNAGIRLTDVASSVADMLLCADQVLTDNEEFHSYLLAYADKPNRTIYLTVDDGPSGLTRGYLDVLKANGVRATFFVIGKNAKKYPGLIKEMYADGHCIANHSYTHNYPVLYKTSESLFSELRLWEETIDGILGFQYDCKIFRFPGGSTYKLARKYTGAVTARGYTYYDWNCLTGDAQIKDRSADNLYNYMLSTFKEQPEVILLMHDTDNKQTSVDMLGRAIAFYKEKGYEFHTLDEKPQ